MRFIEGDIVRIAKNSWLYGQGDENPSDIKGEISIVNDNEIDNYPIRVYWENGYNCVYREKDLKLVRRA